jgi:RND superfamily putative drug exporter
VPILLFWVGLVVVLSVTVPQLEVVGEQHSVSLAPDDAPSLQAMKRVGQVFNEFNSNSSAMIVLEGDAPLGADAHDFYDGLIAKLRSDTTHVQNIQDFWGDPLTAAGSQSADGKAAYVQLYLAGNQGQTLAGESIQSVRDAVSKMTPPAGVKVFVTGPAAMTYDQHHAGADNIDDSSQHQQHADTRHCQRYKRVSQRKQYNKLRVCRNHSIVFHFIHHDAGTGE